jgi:GAF domain-containing protein/HAMP domain-containing protein
MKIRTKLYLAFTSIFLFVALISAVGLINLAAISQQFQDTNNIQFRLARLADDIRYYDVTLTDAVRAYLIDPQDREAYDAYFRDAEALDGALAEAQSLATSEEDKNIFANIARINERLVLIEEGLLNVPNIQQAIPLYRTTYGDLKADYSAQVQTFFQRQQRTLEEEQANILARLNQSFVVNLVLLGILLVTSVLIYIILSRSILNPIASLNSVTQQIATGDFDAPLPNAGSDEIGNLTNNFGAMVQHVRDTLNVLETRSRELRTISDVGAQIATILDVNRLLQDVVDLTKERFRLYHAHLYMLNEAGNTLVLTAGAGHVGRQMVAEKRSIDLNSPQSIVARAANSRKGVIVNDVTASPTFLPHPLLPDTRSELAVPLIARGQLIGVLDVQSDEVDYFLSEDVLTVIQLMAAQIASALSNARLYEVAERTSRHERALGSIDRKIRSALDMDDVLKTAVRELGKALRVPLTAIELQAVSEDTVAPSNGETEDSHV